MKRKVLVLFAVLLLTFFSPAASADTVVQQGQETVLTRGAGTGYRLSFEGDKQVLTLEDFSGEALTLPAVYKLVLRGENRVSGTASLGDMLVTGDGVLTAGRIQAGKLLAMGRVRLMVRQLETGTLILANGAELSASGGWTLENGGSVFTDRPYRVNGREPEVYLAETHIGRYRYELTAPVTLTPAEEVAEEVEEPPIPTVPEDIELQFSDGRTVTMPGYTIQDQRFCKLRDMAMVLNTYAPQSKKFAVGWDEESRTVTLTQGLDYTPAGGELADNRTFTRVAATKSQSRIRINGRTRGDLLAYNIGGNNWLKTTELLNALGIQCIWDGELDKLMVFE